MTYRNIISRPPLVLAIINMVCVPTNLDALYAVPAGERVVEEFREVELGVWFPLRAHAIGYDASVLETEGVQKLSWEQRYDVEEISLHPRYPGNCFAHVPLHDGTAVYEVTN